MPRRRKRNPDDWPFWLDNYLRDQSTKKFKWGKHDCCVFAAKWIKTVEGWDPYEGFKERYKTEVGAKRTLAWHGVGGLENTVTTVLKRDPIKPTFAQRGDLVSVLNESNQVCLGIVWAGKIYCLEPTKGLVVLPFTHGRHAWRVYKHPEVA